MRPSPRPLTRLLRIRRLSSVRPFHLHTNPQQALRDDPPHTAPLTHIQPRHPDHPLRSDDASPLRLTPLPRPPAVPDRSRSPPLSQPVFEQYFPPLHERGWVINVLPEQNAPLLRRTFRLASLPKSIRLVHDVLNLLHDENHTSAYILLSEEDVTVYLHTPRSEHGISLMDLRVALMLEFMFLSKITLGSGYEGNELKTTSDPPTWKKYEEVVKKPRKRKATKKDVKSSRVIPTQLTPLPRPPIRDSNLNSSLTKPTFDKYIVPLYERGWRIDTLPNESGSIITILKRHFHLSSFRASSQFLHTVTQQLDDESHTAHICISIQHHKPVLTLLLLPTAEGGLTLKDVRVAVLLETRFRESHDDGHREECVRMEWGELEKVGLEKPRKRRVKRGEWDLGRVEAGVLGLCIREEGEGSSEDVSAPSTVEDVHPTSPTTLSWDDSPYPLPLDPPVDFPPSASFSSLEPQDPLALDALSLDAYLPPIGDLDLSLTPEDADPFLTQDNLSSSGITLRASPAKLPPTPTVKETIPKPEPEIPPAPITPLPDPPSTERYKGRWPWINHTLFEEYMPPLYERRWDVRLLPGDYPGHKIAALERRFHHASFAKSTRFFEEVMDLMRNENRVPIHISISTRHRWPIVTLLLYTKGNSVILPPSLRNEEGERAGVAGITLMDVKLAVMAEEIFQARYLKSGKWEPREEVGEEEKETERGWREKPDWERYRKLLAWYSIPRQEGLVVVDPRPVEKQREEGRRERGEERMEVEVEEEIMRWDDAVSGLYRLRDKVSREMSIRDLRE